MGLGLLGGIIGSVMGGPLGGIIGFGLGALFDNQKGKIGQENVYKEETGNSENQNFYKFCAGLFSIAGKIAKADGVVTSEEIAVVDNFITDNLQFDAQQKKFAITVFQKAKDDNFSAREYLQDFKQFLDAKNAESILNFYVAIAMSDGELNDAELSILKDAEQIFELHTGTLSRLLGNYDISLNRSNAEFYKVLEVAETASDSEVSQAYRKKVREFHPDKIASKNLPKEFEKFAATEFSKIHAAYQAIKKERKL